MTKELNGARWAGGLGAIGIAELSVSEKECLGGGEGIVNGALWQRKWGSRRKSLPCEKRKPRMEWRSQSEKTPASQWEPPVVERGKKGRGI